MAKLREAVADPTRPLSARTLAKFLVQKKHLSQRQATDVINSLLAAGVDVDKTGPPSTIISASPREHAELDDADDDPEGSSIFAPFLPAPAEEVRSGTTSATRTMS